MVRLLSRIMSMTVLMACIHMDVRHLFASAYYTNYRCTLVKVKLSAGASLQILSSDKCFSAQIAQPRCSKIRFSAQDSGNMLTSSMVEIRPKMLSHFSLSVFFYHKESCIFVMALPEYLTKHGFNSGMITGVFYCKLFSNF